ncbi:MAG: hypothetical protein U0841_14910 [Chloroflexia bacterium]
MLRGGVDGGDRHAARGRGAAGRAAELGWSPVIGDLRIEGRRGRRRCVWSPAPRGYRRAPACIGGGERR